MTATDLPTLSATTERARRGTPRHRADPNPIAAARAAVRAYRAELATRRTARAQRRLTDLEEETP